MFTMHVYRDDAGEWRWNIKAGNHKVVGDSSEGYIEKRKAVDMAARLSAGGMRLVIDDE